MLPAAYKTYLLEIQLAPPLIERVEKIYSECKVLDLDIDSDIFITETIDAEGKRIYQNLWFFGDEDAIEAKGFIGEDNYDLVKLKDRIVYWNVVKKNFQFGESANDESRVSVNFNLGEGGVGGDFRSSKKNCEKLYDIFKKYMIGNLK